MEIKINIKINSCSPETAMDLVSSFFSQITVKEKIRPLSGEFECFEEIAKGFAMLAVVRQDHLNSNKKKILLQNIKKL